MFAKPHWFRPKAIGEGVAPATWHGWLYVVGAVSVTLIPVLLLLGRGQRLESLIWLVAIGGFLAYELWYVRRLLMRAAYPCGSAAPVTATAIPTAKPPAADDGIYFLDDRQGSKPVNTTRFQLSLKQ